MFDVGFSELLVIAVVALVVIGPERLPRVARTVGHLYGRLQRYVSQVKSDIHREMEAADLGKVKTEFEDAARSFKTDVEAQAASFRQEVNGAQEAIERDIARPVGEAAAPADPAPPSPQLELGIEPPPAVPPSPAPPREEPRAPGAT